jgi:MiaB/RimO family radical SAM methylthiotransferase
MKVHVFANTSCIYRNLDCSRIINYFHANNTIIVDNIENADFVVLITCAFREDCENRCWKLIHEISKKKREIIVGGCLPEISSEFSNKYIGKFFTTRNINDIDKLFPHFKVKFCDINDANFFPTSYKQELNSNLITSHKISCRNLRLVKISETAFLRIGRGCLGNCSYCAIKKAIGKHISKALSQCLNEYKTLLEKGYCNICISGDDTGAYGKDINLEFPDLLRVLFENDPTNYVKWIFEDIYPKWIIEYSHTFIKYANKTKVIQAVIQSGSERILELMYRKIHLEEYKKIFKKLKEINNQLIIEAQIIIGFPTETQGEFFDTLNLIKEICCEFVFISGFSERKGTQAELMEGKLTQEEIIKRIEVAKDFFNKNNIKWSCHI